METEQRSELIKKWKQMAFLGPLPRNFLRVENTVTSQQQQEAADREAALALQHLQMQNLTTGSESRMGRLTITISQAKLVKNYGVTRMDPYVRLRVGHAVYETHSDTNGGKNPHWNKDIQCLLPPGVTQVYIEIYDECSFTMDELIAWGHIEIPPQVIQNGETHEDWYMLSGKQGENQEGMINLVFSYTTVLNHNYWRHTPYMSVPPIMAVPSTMFGVNSYAPVNVYMTPQPTANPTVLPSTLPQAEEELKQIAEMFPNIDNDTIKSVYDVNNGKKASTINALLQMSE